MKHLFLITLLAFSFGLSAYAQLNTGLGEQKQFVRNEWQPIDTVLAVRGNTVLNDSVMYTITEDLPEFLFKNIRNETQVFGDTIYNFTTRLNCDIYRSRAAVVNRLVKIWAIVPVEKSNDQKLIDFLIQAKQLNVNDNNFFWNYGPIKAIITPPEPPAQDSIK